MIAILLNHNIIDGVIAHSAIAEVYKRCKQDESLTDSVEDTDVFFRLWELHNRKYYFNNQIKDIDKEIDEIINKKI